MCSEPQKVKHTHTHTHTRARARTQIDKETERVQFKMVSMRSEKLICAPPVSQKFPQCRLWNGSIVRLTDDGPLSSFQGRLSIASSFHASPPSVRWCGVLGFVPAGSVSNSSTLQIFWEATHNCHKRATIVRVALPASLSARSFPITPACSGKYTGVFEGGCQSLMHSSLAFPFHFSFL